jgi:outer membrane protein assembly factor BamB
MALATSVWRPFLCLCLATSFASTVQSQTPQGDKFNWPGWRGPHHDGVSRETGLLKEWPKEGPRVVWQVENVGVAYSSLAVVDGRIYTLGDLDGVEHIICLSEKDGSRIWAVQPEPVKKALEERVATQMKQADRNGNGVLDEPEALARLGRDFGRFDRPESGDPAAIAAHRGKRLLEQLDKNTDGTLTFDEAGQAFRETLPNIDAADKEANMAELVKRRTAALVKTLDANGDGKLDRREADKSPLGPRFGQIDQKPADGGKADELISGVEIEAYFTKFEAGKDGSLTLDELSAYYLRTSPGCDGRLTAEELRGALGGYRNGYGDGPRGTPTVDGDKLYVEGGSGDLTCLETKTGQTIWHRNLARDLAGGVPGWGYSESPLIVGDRLFVTPGGAQGTVACLNKLTGEVIWRSGNKEGAHYSSPVLAELAGRRQIVQFARNSVFGVDFETGQLLWNYGAANNGTANVCTPIAEASHVFASSGYGTGGGLVKISSTGDGQKADEVYFEKRMANHHGGIIKVGDYLYGFGNGGLMCLHYLSGKVAWTARSVGKGSLTCADGMLYLLGEGHQVALAEANPQEYKERGRFRIENLGRSSWAHPVVCNSRLYIRNLGRLTAYDVADKR